MKQANSELIILYIASEPTLAMNISAIARGFEEFDVPVRNVLVDPREYLWTDFSGKSIYDELECSEMICKRLEPDYYKDVLLYHYPDRSYIFYFKLFERVKPSIVVVMHEYGYSFYAVQAAIILGIPTYHVQHAMIEPERFEPYTKVETVWHDAIYHYKTIVANKYRYFASVAGKIAKRSYSGNLLTRGHKLISEKEERYPLYADRIAVWSDYYMYMVSENRQEYVGRIDVIGFPHADAHFAMKRLSKEDVFSKYDFFISERLAIYLYCPFHEITLQYVTHIHPDNALLEAIIALRQVEPDINILILPHPNHSQYETIQRLNKLLKHLHNIAIESTSRDYLTLCGYASVVLGVMSSLFYITALTTVPVVVQAYVVSDIIDYQSIEAGAVIPVFHRSSLHQQIVLALSDNAFIARLKENQNELTEKMLGKFDGKSGIRTASSILDLLSTTSHEISELT